MKKILLITDAWYPQVNGVVHVFDKIIKLSKKKGFACVIIHPGMFKTIPMPTYHEIKLSLFSKKKVSKIIEKEKPDFIHIATEGPLGISARKVCIKKNIPFTSSYHTRFDDFVNLRVKLLSPKTIFKYLRWFHNKAKKVMTATNSMKLELEESGIKNVKIWPLGTDNDLFKRNPNAKIPNDLKKPIFTYLGRIAIEKNIEEFLKLDLPGTKLIIGDGPLKEKLQKKYSDGAVFVGYKYGQDIVDLLSISDVFVFPSLTDTFGLVVVEALACALPVAAFNVQGPKDIITNGFDGYIGDDLKKNALKCLKLNKKNCRKTALKYSWEKSTEIFISNLVEINYD